MWFRLYDVRIVQFHIIDGPDVQNLMDLLHLLIFIAVMEKGENKMARYIDANNINLRGIAVFDQNLEILIPLSDVRKALQMTPTADVREVNRGKMNMYKPRIMNRNATYKCSVCGKLCSSYYNDVREWKFCPHCGAKMDLES